MEKGGNEMSRQTPETDACIIERRKIHKSDGSVQLVELIDAEFARRLERERDEAREELNKKYIEYDKLFDEAELIRIERDQISEALIKIEEIFIDGEDTYDDWLAMGKIARATLEDLNQQ